MSELTTFQRKLEERRQAEAAARVAAEGPATPVEFSDLVPDAEASYERSEDDILIDRIIANLSVDKAYDRWIGKPRPSERSGKREGVMISCPTPEHADRNPSAWMNLDKNTWFCAGCDRGGDVLDLASFHFGIPDYKTGSNFAQLREAIAADFGYQRVHAPGLPREGALVAPESEDSTASVPTPPVSPVLPPQASTGSTSVEPETVHVDANSTIGESTTGDGATVTYLPDALDDDDKSLEQLPGLDWRSLITPGTFLDEYMAACTVDDVPEEYHFWNGLLALGLAVGRDVTLDDYHPVLANLFVCILGRTGVGKSRATSHLSRLVEGFIAEDRTDQNSRGARTLSTAGSAEVLIKNFSKPQWDAPTTPGGKPILTGYGPVRALVEYSELSGLVGRAGRTGSTLKPTLMEFFDGKPVVSNASLSNGEQVAHLPFANLITSTQPKALKTLLDQGDADSGFLNRWIFVTGIEKPRTAIGGARIDLNRAGLKLREVHMWAEPDPVVPEDKVVAWGDEAREVFTTFFHDTIEPMKRGGGVDDDREFFQRLDLLMKKLILLFTINEKLETVPLSAVHKAITVFWYLVKVLEIPSSSIGMSVQSQLEQAVIELMKRYMEKNGDDGKGVPLYYITKILGKKKQYTYEMIERALKTLTSLNLLHVEKPTIKGPGRPPVARYRLATAE